MRKLRVLTPELAPLEYRLAGLPERGLAWAVDEAIVVSATSLIYFLAAMFGVATAGLGISPALGVAFISGLAIEIGYRWVAESRWRGRTFGKRLFALRAVQDNGADLLAWQAFVRNAARVLDALPMFQLLGAASATFDPMARRIGDRLAGTVVIRETVHEPPRAARQLADAQNSLSEDPAAASRIRARLTEREGAVLAEFVAAAPRMETSRRLALAARIATPLRDRLGLAAHSGIPDEVLLRGVVGVLARDRFGAPARTRS